MIINTVRLARLVNTGSYENTRFEVEAIPEEHEDAAVVAANLSAMIRRMITAERRARFPDPARRRWQEWLTPDEDLDPEMEDPAPPAPSTESLPDGEISS